MRASDQTFVDRANNMQKGAGSPGGPLAPSSSEPESLIRTGKRNVRACLLSWYGMARSPSPQAVASRRVKIRSKATPTQSGQDFDHQNTRRRRCIWSISSCPNERSPSRLSRKRPNAAPIRLANARSIGYSASDRCVRACRRSASRRGNSLTIRGGSAAVGRISSPPCHRSSTLALAAP